MSTWVEQHKESDPDRLPVQLAYTGESSWWAYINSPGHSDLLSYAGQFMANWKEGTPDWLSVYPIERDAENVDPARPLFVDIGGGLGHQCQLLRQKKPELQGKVILQDLPVTLQNAPPIQGVGFVEQDFFQPQRIQGKVSSQQA